MKAINVLKKFCFISFVTLFLFQGTSNAEGNELASGSIYKQHQLQQEGKRLADLGELDSAIIKFREALEPQYIQHEGDKGFAKYFLTKIFIRQKKYEEALREYQWFIDQNKSNGMAKIHVQEIHALKEYESTGHFQPVLDFIQLLKEEYATSLPPLGYDSGIGISQIATILRLYNTIGDHDAGIAYIDEVLAYFRTGKAGDPKPGKVDAAYLKIREAFEQDKEEGFKGCAGFKHDPANPNNVCMGRATKALIQSDYFPW